MEYAPLPSDAQLAALAAELAGGDISHVRRIAGGLSCTTDVIARDGGDRLVLRRYGPWWNEAAADPAVVEFTALKAATRAGVPVPEPLWVDRRGLFDEKAVVISYEEGSPLLTPEDPLDWAEQLAVALAAIHDVTLAPEERSELRDIGALERAAMSQASAPQHIADHALGGELWERRHHVYASTDFVDPVFTHGDFWPGNTLWVENTLMAVVDWEEASVGDPACDVAYTALDLSYLSLDDAAKHFIATYRIETGRDLASLGYWHLAGLCRPMPDIVQWLPSWQQMGLSELTADVLRGRHSALIEAALR